MQALTQVVTSPLDVLSQTEQCVVCGDSADGFHYGVRSCRGCNAFFRRAVTYDMQFSCRRGGKCPVDKNARCACRACRLAKCVSVGMDRKAVQPKRENNGTCAEPSAASVAVKSEPSPEDAAPKPLQRSSSLDEMFIPVLPPSPPPDCGLISRQCHEYQDQKRRRRTMLCNTLHEILADEVDTTIRGRATSEDYSDIFQVQMVLMFEWAEKLPEFRKITDPHDKTKLLRVFALRYILLDNVFHTMELGFNDRLVLVNNSFMKPGDWPTFETTESADERTVKFLMFGDDLQRLLNEIINPIKNMGLTTGELMTLRMIMFWNPGPIGLSLQGLQIAEEASQSAVKELQNYFTAEGIVDVENRIGNLLLLLPAFTRHVQYLYDIVKLIPSFGQMKDWENFMNDLLRGF